MSEFPAKFPFFPDTLAGAILGRFNITRCWSDCTTICIYNSHDGTYWYIFVHTDDTSWYILMVNSALKSAQSEWKHINRSLVLNHGFSLTQQCDIMQMVEGPMVSDHYRLLNSFLLGFHL